MIARAKSVCTLCGNACRWGCSVCSRCDQKLGMPVLCEPTEEIPGEVLPVAKVLRKGRKAGEVTYRERVKPGDLDDLLAGGVAP